MYRESSGLLDNQTYKVAILGSGAVGKTSLTIRFFNNTWSDQYNPTFQDIYGKEFELDNEKGELEILDTAGMEQYTVLQEQWITAGRGFVLMYSIIDRESFKEVRNLRKKIEQIKLTKSIPMALVGNKADMASERVVLTEEGEAMANEFKCPFFETSAKTGDNCTETFFEVVREIRKTELKKQTVESSAPKKSFLICC